MKQNSELRDLCASAVSPLLLLWLRLCRARSFVVIILLFLLAAASPR